MFEIWRHVDSGARYLVVYREGRVNVAAGPLNPHENPRSVLQHQSNQEHNPRVLLHMNQAPQEYTRELMKDIYGQIHDLGPDRQPDTP